MARHRSQEPNASFLESEPAPAEASALDIPNVLSAYLDELNVIRSSGAGVPETSYYPALANLFNSVGKTLRPRVRCIIHTRNQGAGIPDGGLFTAEQFGKQSDAAPGPGQLPLRGVIEVKGADVGVSDIAASAQVRGYLQAYGLVIVSNLRDFLIVERGMMGEAVTREAFSLAADEADFWLRTAAHPRATEQRIGPQFMEFMKRACLHAAPLQNPKDVAWFLASYARDALARVEAQKELPALQTVRTALEDALGMRFTDERGEHFFRSTLVQTLFYGVFSAWVSWHKASPGARAEFNWRTAEWSLHVPFIRALYEEIAKPGTLGPLGLVEVLDWAAAVLGRVNRGEFFGRFHDDQAVQYFYEPFLEAYDPDLRKELGVWYTPPEIVQYQVARVDQVLREELELPLGLADPNVVILDPCCGTGTYLVEALRSIARTLRAGGGDALVASDLKKAAIERVYGFEIMPAPFVVAHLQLGALLQNEGAPLAQGLNERVGVYLTNALTGWAPATGIKQNVPLFPELQQERDAAERVKREKKILVVIGNPPYNAFAGVSPEEEQGLVEPYKLNLNASIDQGGWGIRKFNLDDLYVRFFRLAERRIAEMSGRGVVSFISNQSWVAEPSFVVLRKHLLGSFDKFWVENLHGNRKISEYAPDGRTSETIFAIRGFSVGIQQGVATSLWVKKSESGGAAPTVRFRDDLNAARADERRAQLLKTLDRKNFDAAYTRVRPRPENRYSFRPEKASAEYIAWPRMVELCAIAPMNGLMEKRGGALIDIDRDRLEARMRDYCNVKLSWREYKTRHSALARDAAGFSAELARAKVLRADSFKETNLVRYAVRPFDIRWCYYTPVSPIWNRSRPELWKQHQLKTAFLMARPSGVAAPEGTPISFTRCLGDNDYQRGHAYYFPFLFRNGHLAKASDQPELFDKDVAHANLSARARLYLAALKIPDPDADHASAALLWMHVLAIGYSPEYLAENADGLRHDWPRIPLPPDRKRLSASAKLGEKVAALLDTETDVPGVTSGVLAPGIRRVAVVSKQGGGDLNPSGGALALTAPWSHKGKDDAVMPAKGKVIRRPYDAAEKQNLDAEAKRRGVSSQKILQWLGTETCDVFLNDVAYWRNIPANVWEYRIGGYQVIKKWLSYRSLSILDRPLLPTEVREVSNIARRLTALLLEQGPLDENYRLVKAAAADWADDDS